MRRIAVLGSLALLSTLCLGSGACTSHEGPVTPPPKEGTKTEPPTPDPTPEPPVEPFARAAIASVQLIEDCPNQNDGWRPPPVVQDAAKPAAAAPAAAAPAADEEMAMPGPPMPPAEGAAAARSAGSAIGGGGPWVQPCTQSTMQVVFSGQGSRTATVDIERVQLLDPKTGKSVATLEAREPASWADGAYQSWNETIGPRQEVKASYELTVPDWYKVEQQLGIPSSDGVMFMLELEVKVGDERQTVRSSEFPREQPHVVVT